MNQRMDRQGLDAQSPVAGHGRLGRQPGVLGHLSHQARDFAGQRSLIDRVPGPASDQGRRLDYRSLRQVVDPPEVGQIQDESLLRVPSIAAMIDTAKSPWPSDALAMEGRGYSASASAR